MQAVHQLVAGFDLHDSVSELALTLQRMFRSWGCESRIYADTEFVGQGLHTLVCDANQIGVEDASATYLLHLSIGSTVNSIFDRLTADKIIYYHNMTPAKYFSGCDDHAAGALAWGRRQLASMANSARVSLAASEFSAAELRALDFANVRTLPVVIDYEKHCVKACGKTLERFNDQLKTIVFVGRAVPHKCLHDCIGVFGAYQKSFEPGSRFIHVGSFPAESTYPRSVGRLVEELELDNVELLGTVEQPRLNAVYAAADTLLCMSEHEGYCIPLIESMLHGVPVLAYDAGAVAETLGGAGVLVDHKDHYRIAKRIHRLNSDPLYRQQVISAQDARIARLRRRDLESEMFEVVVGHSWAHTAVT